jgi:hypothetical protein
MKTAARWGGVSYAAHSFGTFIPANMLSSVVHSRRKASDQTSGASLIYLLLPHAMRCL